MGIIHYGGEQHQQHIHRFSPGIKNQAPQKKDAVFHPSGSQIIQYKKQWQKTEQKYNTAENHFSSPLCTSAAYHCRYECIETVPNPASPVPEPPLSVMRRKPIPRYPEWHPAPAYWPPGTFPVLPSRRPHQWQILQAGQKQRNCLWSPPGLPVFSPNSPDTAWCC